MGFVKSIEELEALSKAGPAEFYDAEMLWVYWETKPEIVERLLPPPLEALERPLVAAFIANYPRTSFGLPYREAALFLSAQHKGDIGAYCLAMPVTDDMAMGLGREKYGFPKKMANITFMRRDDYFEGSVERHGVPFFNVKAKLNTPPNAKDFSVILDEVNGPNPDIAVTYNHKAFMAPAGGFFDYNPRLVRAEVTWRHEDVEYGSAQVTLTPSPADPWAEVEIARMLGAVYTMGHNTLCDGDVVAEGDMLSYTPYAFMKWDF